VVESGGPWWLGRELAYAPTGVRQAWSGLFCLLPTVLLQQIEKRLVGKVLKFLLPIACQQFEGMPCLIIEMYVLAGQLDLPRACVTTSPFDCAPLHPDWSGVRDRSSVPLDGTPMRRTRSPCCARATIGHAFHESGFGRD
jgi:hypothetical protein